MPVRKYQSIKIKISISIKKTPHRFTYSNCSRKQQLLGKSLNFSPCNPAWKQKSKEKRRPEADKVERLDKNGSVPPSSPAWPSRQTSHKKAVHPWSITRLDWKIHKICFFPKGIVLLKLNKSNRMEICIQNHNPDNLIDTNRKQVG